MNAIDFECPECGAKPGERCRTFAGKWQPVAHAKRKRAAFEEEMGRVESDSPPAPKPQKETLKEPF
jgi:hypothetical protein